MEQGVLNIWQKNHDQVKQVICKKLKGDDSCHDLLQNLFLKIVAKQDRLTLVDKPAAYVMRMAQNVVVDHYRSKRLRAAEVSDCNLSEHEIETISSCEDSISLLPFIQTLPKIYRDILILADLQGMSQKELAERLNISYSNARTRIQRARQMLKQAILACCDYRFDRYGNLLNRCE